MTSNWTSLFVAGSLLFVTTQIAAEEHAVLGQGNVSCGSWLNDRTGEDAASSRIAWVLGYVCPSSNALGQSELFRDGGSGSFGFEFRRLSTDVAIVAV